MKSLIFAVSMVLSYSAFAFPTGPVMVGGDANLDACGSQGVINQTTFSFLEESSGNATFLSVDVDQIVSMCDTQTVDGIDYVGVVYSTEEGVDCGVNTPIEKQQPYQGACKSGWVKAEDVNLIAG